MRIYISGPITNALDYKEKFARAEQNLKSEYPNAEIINPTVLDKLPLEYDEYMKLDLMLLDMCDAIYMMNGGINQKVHVLNTVMQWQEI